MQQRQCNCRIQPTECTQFGIIIESLLTFMQDERDPPSLFIKARCGQSPSVSRFCIQLFHDPFMAQLAETWQIYVHSLQRLDVTGILGQPTKATLVLRGSQVNPHFYIFEFEINFHK